MTIDSQPNPRDYTAIQAFFAAHRSGSMEQMSDTMKQYPELCNEPWIAQIIHHAALAGNLDLFKFLEQMGVDIHRIPVSAGDPERAIGSAASLHRWELVRWLVENGAEINYNPGGGKVMCGPLISAIMAGHEPTVRLLVEAGALLNVIDNCLRTSLDWAIAYSQPEIANYLVQKGAVVASVLPDYQPPVRNTDPIVITMEERYGPTKLLFKQSETDVSSNVGVRAILHEDYIGLFTHGMSKHLIKSIDESDAPFGAELVMQLPDDWYDVFYKSERWKEPEFFWPIHWIYEIAKLSSQSLSWPWDQTTVISNGNPPRPLSLSTSMTCWLLLPRFKPFSHIYRFQDIPIVFYTLIPIHTAEFEYQRTYGILELAKRLDIANIDACLRAERPSVIC